MRRRNLILSLLVAISVLVQVACTKILSGDIKPDVVEEWHCGQQTISTRFVDEQLRLMVGEKHYVLDLVVSASGAKYESASDEQTSLWFKGWEASLQLQGRDYPRCVPADGVVEPFRASGNEPFWSVALNHGMLTVNRLGQGSMQPLPYSQAGPGEPITAGAGDEAIVLLVQDGLCRDNMSAMPFPQQVELTIGTEMFRGCGGDSARLLQGVEWLVEEISNNDVIDNAPVTVNFEVDGTINGRASCNRFMGRYQLTGESLTTAQIATTRMACEVSLMEQESAVLKSLEGMQSFDFREDGALILRSRARSLVARPTSG